MQAIEVEMMGEDKKGDVCVCYNDDSAQIHEMEKNKNKINMAGTFTFVLIMHA